MSYTVREFSHAAKKWLLLLLQKYRGKTLYQSLWGEIRGIRSCRSHSELRKHQIVVEEDICVVFTKICRSCCLHDGILNDGMYAETLKIHLSPIYTSNFSLTSPLVKENLPTVHTSKFSLTSFPWQVFLGSVNEKYDKFSLSHFPCCPSTRANFRLDNFSLSRKS